MTMTLDHDKPNLGQHLGVDIGKGKCIHIRQKTGVVVTRIDDVFFKRKIRGYYRWKNS